MFEKCLKLRGRNVSHIFKLVNPINIIQKIICIKLNILLSSTHFCVSRLSCKSKLIVTYNKHSLPNTNVWWSFTNYITYIHKAKHQMQFLGTLHSELTTGCFVMSTKSLMLQYWCFSKAENSISRTFCLSALARLPSSFFFFSYST